MTLIPTLCLSVSSSDSSLPPHRYIISSFSSTPKTLLSVVSPRDLSMAQLFCSRWSAASHLCCLCGAVICLRAGFVGLPVWGQAWWAPMMEIVLSAAASPRLSQDSSVAGHREEQRLRPRPVPKRNPGKMFYWTFMSKCFWNSVCKMEKVYRANRQARPHSCPERNLDQEYSITVIPSHR